MSRCFLGVIHAICVSKSFGAVSAIELYMQSWGVPVLEEF